MSGDTIFLSALDIGCRWDGSDALDLRKGELAQGRALGVAGRISPHAVA